MSALKPPIPPRADRIARVTVHGAEFVVAWDEEVNEEERYQFGTLPAGRACWVDMVRFDGVWFYAVEVLTSDLIDDLDAALMALEDNR